MLVVLEIAAVSANIMFVWPQTIKLLRTRDTQGISLLTWCISFTLFTVWGIYALQEQYWSLLIANVSCWVAATIILAVGVRNGWPARTPTYTLLGTLVVVAAGIINPVVLVVIMSVSGVALRTPQLVKLLRTKNVSGVASTTWILSTFTAAAWLTISVSRDATGAAIANATALTAGTILLVALFTKKHVGSTTTNPT